MKRVMICQRHLGIHQKGCPQNGISDARERAKGPEQRAKMDQVERNGNLRGADARPRGSPQSVGHVAQRGCRAHRLATAASKDEWEKTHGKKMTQRFPMLEHPTTMAMKDDGNTEFEMAWLTSAPPMMPSDRHYYGDQAKDVAADTAEKEMPRLKVSWKNFADGMNSLPASLVDAHGEPKLRPLGFTMGEWGNGEVVAMGAPMHFTPGAAMMKRRGEASSAADTPRTPAARDGNLDPMERLAAFLVQSCASGALPREGEGGPGDGMMAETLDDAGMGDVAGAPRQTTTFNLDEPVTRSKRDDAESMISLGSAALGGKADAQKYIDALDLEVRVPPVANAVIWKTKVDMMLQADVTKGSASAMFRACTPMPLPASMDQAFDVRTPCLSRLSALDEWCKIRRLYLYFCESWFLPKLESGCHEEIISSTIVDMRQYINRVLESCHIGEVTVKFFTGLNRLLRGTQDCARIEEIFDCGESEAAFNLSDQVNNLKSKLVNAAKITGRLEPSRLMHGTIMNRIVSKCLKYASMVNARDAPMEREAVSALDMMGETSVWFPFNPEPNAALAEIQAATVAASEAESTQLITTIVMEMQTECDKESAVLTVELVQKLHDCAEKLSDNNREPPELEGELKQDVCDAIVHAIEVIKNVFAYQLAGNSASSNLLVDVGSALAAVSNLACACEAVETHFNWDGDAEPDLTAIARADHQSKSITHEFNPARVKWDGLVNKGITSSGHREHPGIQVLVFAAAELKK
ncbi:unnamed protein product, partial [Prorocentrum cordatum]